MTVAFEVGAEYLLARSEGFPLRLPVSYELVNDAGIWQTVGIVVEHFMKKALAK